MDEADKKRRDEQAGLEVLMNAMIFGPENAIEISEKQGQLSMCHSVQLPKECNNGSLKNNTEEIYGKLGIKIIKEADDLFYFVELPKDWKLVPGEHSMGSNLQDANGRIRASIFYKAAFYDRRAFFTIQSRFKYRITDTHFEGIINREGDETWDHLRDRAEHFGRVYDGKQIVFETPKIKFPKYESNEENNDRINALSKQLHEQCIRFLQSHGITEWENPFLYWDQTFAFEEK